MAEFWPLPLSSHGPWPDHDETPQATAASRMEAGTSAVANVVGLGAALEMHLRLGPQARAHVARLAGALKRGAAAIPGVRVATPMEAACSTGLTTLTFDGLGREGLMALVYDLYATHGINVKFQYLQTMYSRASRADPDAVGMRISVAFFNTEAEVAKLLAALRLEVEQLALVLDVTTAGAGR